MDTWQILLTFALGALLAFPAAILTCAGLGWAVNRWQATSMSLWIKRRNLREGKLIVRWPAHDLREDVLIVDLSRITRDEIGVKRRRYCVLRRRIPPAYGTVEYVTLRKL
jgi:hypothetical protein